MKPGRLVPRALGVALLAIVAVLAVGSAAFFSGVEISGEFLRPRLERTLSAAFRLPTRLEGPLRLRTGTTATLAADALIVADPAAGARATLGRGIRPRARIDLVALLRGTVAIDEVTGERLELSLARGADGRGNWSPIFTRPPGGGEPSVTFDGIARLRIGRIVGSYRREGDAPLPFEITDFDGGLPRHAPITARGGFRSGVHAFTFELRTASLAESGAAAVPVGGAIDWAGLRANFDGAFIREGSRLDVRIDAAAADAGAPLAALGLAAREPGPLEARVHLNLAAGEATMRDLDLRLGDLRAAGEAGVAWGGTRPRLTAILAAGKIDLRPYLAATAPADRIWPEVFVEWLQLFATGVDAEVTLSATEIAGLAADVSEVTVEAHSRDLAVDMTGAARVAGVQVASSVAYDARQPRRTLAARIDGGAASTAALGAGMQPRGWTASVGALRGRLDAGGTDARSIIASAQGGLEARDLRWSIDRGHGGTQSGRFDRLRVSLRGDRPVSVDVAGRIGGGACSLTLSGAALAPLLAGESWPVQGSGRCPGERFSAKGSLALAAGQPNASLAIDVAADRPGPIAGLLGAGQPLPYPLSARGTLALDASSASITFDALQLGRSAGAGDAQWPRGTDGAASVRLAFTALDLDELGELAGGAPAADPLRRKVLPSGLPLADLDFELTAERVAVSGAALRQAGFTGALRSQVLPPAKFRFEWDGVTFSGQFGADFNGAAPRLEIDAAARDIDLRAWLARVGRSDIDLRAAALSLSARAQGARVGELLASATVHGAFDRGRLVLPAVGSSLAGAIDFSATLEAAPGKPTRLTANGAVNGEPIRLALDAGALGELAGAGDSLPLALRASSGDIRLEATGRVALDGSGEARLQLDGRRLERLGALIGVTMPAAEPYSARGKLRVSAGAIDVDDLDLAAGRSRIAGSFQFGRAAGRKTHRANLLATALHLEDLTAGGRIRFDDESPREARATAQAVAEATAWLLDILSRTDFDLALDIESLLGAGQPLASGRLAAQAGAGTLRLTLTEVLTAGGEVNAELRVDATAAPPGFALSARARDLEYGPMLRALDPSTSLEGALDFNADLAARAPPEQVLRELGGTIDAATFPRGLQPRALNLWGVSLVNPLLRQLDPDARSSIDCAVAGFDVERGVARSRGFFVDTTRVRIVGEVEIDLVTRALAGRIDPRSKAPQLLAVAPTMLLGGTAENPRVSAAPQNIVTLPLRFAATLGGLVGNWRTGRAETGPAACREAFELLRAAVPAAN